jgi:hypothetical protein
MNGSFAEHTRKQMKGDRLMQNMIEHEGKHVRKENTEVSVGAIKVFGEHTRQYMRLEAAAKLLNAEMDPEDKGVFEVRNIYFDYGQGWMWTTIVFNGGDQWSSYQALNPKHQSMIVCGDLEMFTQAVWAVIERRKDHMHLLND